MAAVTLVGIDLAKQIFHLHGCDAAGEQVFSRKIRRSGLTEFVAALPPCTIAMEACGGAHHFARCFGKMGHDVMLLPAAAVKAFVGPHKNDAIDARAITEAARRPGARTVPIKSEANQAALAQHRVRALLVGQRTSLMNALRGHFAEFGVVYAKGASALTPAIERLCEGEAPDNLPEDSIAALAPIARSLRQVTDEIAALDQALMETARKDPVADLLMDMPGIGPITATALRASLPEPERFATARCFTAWLGLVPRQLSTGGKTKLGRITKAGDGYLRRLLVQGAMSRLRIVRCALKRGDAVHPWLERMATEKPTRLAAVAIAAKMARAAWAMMVTGETWREPTVAAHSTA